jgi:large subunit ribosomal protein L11
MAQNVEAIVDGGKASAGPPLGPALGPTGVNIGKVIAAINEKTKEFMGMKVPVTVAIDDKKDFTIKVGTPPASQLVIKKAGVEKGSGNPKTTMVGNITIDDVISIAKMKDDDMLGANLKKKAKEIVGTCVSMGVTVEGENPRTFQRRIDAGEFDGQLVA